MLLTASQIKAIATLHNVAEKPNSAGPPVLENIEFVSNGKTWDAQATERRIVVQIGGKHTEECEPVKALWNAKELSEIAKSLNNDTVIVEISETKTRFTVPGTLTRETFNGTGNYPPLEKLFDTGKRDEAIEQWYFNVNHINMVNKTLTPELIEMRPAHRKDIPLMFRPTGERKPCLITRPHQYGQWRALIMPQLVK